MNPTKPEKRNVQNEEHEDEGNPENNILDIGYKKLCDCKDNHLNCITAKEWVKAQIGVWEFFYEKRDIRDKEKHPAVYPISLSSKVIKLFSHEGELVVDPFVGSGTTLVSAQDLNRNAVGFDINEDYIELSKSRLEQTRITDHGEKKTEQMVIEEDARNAHQYFKDEQITLLLTSPPYSDLLNRERKNKSRRGDERKNEQYQKVEQYSQKENDLGTLTIDEFKDAIEDIYSKLLPKMRVKGHNVINVADMWKDDERIPIHLYVIDAMENAGFELRNTIIWDRTNIVNNVGIFGWPSKYITMGTTFEYILDFWRPPDE